MKYFILLVLAFFTIQINAQELFVMTEPASNMPTGAIGVRQASMFTWDKQGETNFHVMPEVMWGVNKNWMVHATAFLNTTQDQFKLQGGSVYAKYRFFSSDDLHSHFRLAAYGRLSTNSAPIFQEEIETMGMNSGYETGLVATQLVNKTAISASFSYERALKNGDFVLPAMQSNSALNYSLSVGQLLHPKKYTSFEQTNINAMIEFLGQRLNENGKSYLDVVPSIQFIVNSQGRIDLAYRQQLYSTMSRMATNAVLLKLEYTFFNTTK